MKLVSKTNKYYFIFFVLLYPIMIGVNYFLIHLIINEKVDEILLHESERIKYELKHKGELPKSIYLFDSKTVNENFSELDTYSNIDIYDAYSNILTPYRRYEFTAQVNNNKTRISVKHSLLEMNKLIVWISLTTTFIILALVAGLFIINQGIYKWAWKPFFENLSKLTNHEITSKDPISLENSNISEFDELNRIVSTLMKKVRKDFQNLKEFNENISHEIQTPLAIIRNKMVLLLESENFNEKELQWVQTVYQEANKLSKIGKSLTLISRIENQEFARLDSIDLRVTVENIISNMEEMINFKDLKIKMTLNPVKIKCDLILANILLTNLIKNAVQHNQQGGTIDILLTENKLDISNTGEISNVETALLFNRFQRGSTKTESLGLGLAINQKICELYGFKLNYNRHKDKHTFSLYFNN